MFNIPYASGGGGGGFVTKFASPLILVAAGATGTFATITPPSGQKVRLTMLSATSAAQSNLTTITVGGVDVVSAVNLEGENNQTNAANEFKIGLSNGNQMYIEGDIDEVVELKTDVALSNNTIYSYQFGV